MKKFILFFFLSVCPSLLLAQSNVQKFTHALDSLTIVSIDDWKMSPDLRHGPVKGDPTRAGFDDSKWETLKLNESVYPDSCWLRKEIALPSMILGRKISGPVRLIVSVDDYGYMFVNGEDKGYFPWDGDFELTRSAQAGDKFLIAIRAINTGGPLRILRAEIQAGSTDSLRTMVEDFALSVRVGETLLSLDTKQTTAYDNKMEDPGVDKSTMDKAEKKNLNELLQSQVARVDLDALRAGSVQQIMASINDVRGKLKPVADYAKRFTLSFDANAHIDAAWLWR